MSTLIALQNPALTLDGLNLMMTTPDPTYGYLLNALGDGLELGDPEAVIASIQSQLQDGNLERIDRFGNRSATVPVLLDGSMSSSPGEALAQAAAALDGATQFDGWTTLMYTPPLAGAQTCVFEVTSAVVSAGYDDVMEIRAGQRVATLTIHARPFVRPSTLSTIDAPAATGSTTTNIDSGSSTTGWSVLNAPANITNLCPNPSFEVNLTGWAAAAGLFDIQRFTSGGANGAAYLWARGTGSGTSYVAGPSMTAAAGVSYKVQFNSTASGSSSSDMTRQVGVMVRFYASGGAQIGSDNVSSTTAVNGNLGWTSVSYTTPAAPAGTATMAAFPYYQSISGTGDGFGVDGVVVATTAWAGGYFDGATAATGARAHSWTGTANNSASLLTWTAPTLSVVSGMVQGKVFGATATSLAMSMRRAGAITMSTLKYIRIKGFAGSGTGLVPAWVAIGDNGSGPLTTTSYSLNSSTGAFDITIYRPTGFTALDISAGWSSLAVDDYVVIQADSVDITDNPFGNGKVVTRQVPIGGSQRTELSLSVLGLDGAGTTAVGLGEQVLVHTAAKGSDGTAKFGTLRTLSGTGGTSDSTATSGFYTTLGTAASTFSFPTSSLLTGNYMVYARVRSATVGNNVLSFRAATHPSSGDNMYDPRTGYKTAPISFVGATTTWPSVQTNTWAILPLGMLRLPPADVASDTAATIVFEIFRSALGSVDLDDVFFCNADVGQASLIVTATAAGSYSAVRLDAATVASPAPRVWVGVANGTLIADMTRWASGEQHTAQNGLLQISTVTPGCATSRISGSYYRRNHTYLAAS